MYFHFCIIDGVLVAARDGPIRCAEVVVLGVDDVAAVQQQERTRVLRWFVRAGYLDASDAFDMAGGEHGGGFSVDGSVRIEATDRAGRKRLLRHCAPHRSRWTACASSTPSASSTTTPNPAPARG